MSSILLVTCLSLCMLSCAASRVLSKNGDTAVIQGIGLTKTEAKINADKEARRIFIKFQYTKEPEYSQEYKFDEGQGTTYWSCVIEVEKVK